MTGFAHPIAIRKGLGYENTPNWTSIILKYDSSQSSSVTNTRSRFFAERTCTLFYPVLNLPSSSAWEILILITIAYNIIVTIFLFTVNHKPDLSVIILVHAICFLYWGDFSLHVIHRIIRLPEEIQVKRRETKLLILDAFSLAPLSVIFLIVSQSVTATDFFVLRVITFIRFYRIPRYFNYATNTADTYHWKIFLLEYVCYLVLLIHILASVWMFCSDSGKDIEIHEWNKTKYNAFHTSVYFTLSTMLNTGFGDIYPSTDTERILCIIAMFVGFGLTTAVLLGALASEITNAEYKRETYRQEYSATMKELKEAQISDETCEKILDNHVAKWKTRRDVLNLSDFMLLPVSMQKEISFDITFSHFSKSHLFAHQKKSFLRR